MNYMDFRRKLATDEAFARAFVDCKTIDSLIQAAADAGYHFTVEDVHNNTEVLPEELAMASGGINVSSVFSKVYILSPN